MSSQKHFGNENCLLTMGGEGVVKKSIDSLWLGLKNSADSVVC